LYTRLSAASDKVYQLLAHDRWFSPGTPASSTTKTGRHDITEILLKVALKHQKSNQILYSGFQAVGLDMGRGLIPGPIWKMPCNDLFITYFQAEEI
jgi:hypothetical protein